VVFEETVKWDWSAAENEHISVEMEMGEWHSYFDGNMEHGVDCETHNVHQVDQDGGESGEQQTVAEGGATLAGAGMQFGSDQNPTTESHSDIPQSAKLNQESDQEMTDVIDSDDYDETPLRFRSVNEIYQHTNVVSLGSDPEEEEDSGEEQQEDAVDTTALLTVMEEPSNYSEAADDPNWIQAMDSEMQSICKNGTWDLASLPPGQKAIGLKWVYKLKRNADGEVVIHKARLVAKGYVQ